MLEIRNPQMMKKGGGSIVNTSSNAGLVGMANRPAYVASKHSVSGMTKVAALEFAKDNIRVNAVCPGAIRTAMVDEVLKRDPQRETWLLDQHPIGRIGDPAEIAEAVLWLCSDVSSFATGLIMPVDGGYILCSKWKPNVLSLRRQWWYMKMIRKDGYLLSMAYKAFTAVPVSTIDGHYIFDLVIAAGKSLGLNLDELENADGIAREMKRPYDLAMYLPATLIVRIHYGFFCQDAINTCLLARRV